MAASMSAVLCAGAPKQFRSYALHIMLHQPMGGVSGQASDIEIEAREIQKKERTLRKYFKTYPTTLR